MRTLWQLALLALAGPALGLTINAFSPRPATLGQPVVSAAESGTGSCSSAGVKAIQPAPRIGVEEAKALCAACTSAFVDARSASAYADGHIPDAIHLPPRGHPQEKSAIDRLRSFPRVVVYDGENSCTQADDVAERLRQAGLADVRVLTGAWPAWVAAGGPGAAGACGSCSGPGGAP